jgi:hypothetical protein
LRGTPAGLYYEDLWPFKRNLSVSVAIEPDGKFRMVVPPGPGVLLVQSMPGLPGGIEYGFGKFKERDGIQRMFPYAPLESRSKDDGGPEGDATSFPGFNGPIKLAEGRQYHAYRVFDPAADAKALDLTLTVPRAPSRTLKFVDPDGNALRGVIVRGLVPMEWTQVTLDGAEIEILGLNPDKPRELIAQTADGKYIVKTTVGVNDPDPKVIQLKAACAVTGRVVDEAGKPVKGLYINIHAAEGVFIPSIAASDADGRFRAAPLFAGEQYSADVTGGPQGTAVVGKAFDGLVLKPSETHDMGDVRIKLPADAK